MPTGSSVRKATLADAPRLAQALASAFRDDPVIAWIFPDKHRRRGVLPAVRAAGAPEAWQRHLGLLLDGFRAERAHPLPEPPLSPRQVHRAMVTLGRRSAGDTH